MTPLRSIVRLISRPGHLLAVLAALALATACVSDDTHARARARLLRRHGSLSGALSVLRAQSRAPGTSAATHLALAEALLFAQRFGEAEAAARQAVAAMNRAPDAATLSAHDRGRPRRVLALVLARTGRLDEAEESLAESSADADALVILGLLQLERDDLASARVAFAQAAQDGSGGPGPQAVARFNLERIRARSGQQP